MSKTERAEAPLQILVEIESRVRPTICNTVSFSGGQPDERLEGRISAADFEALVRLVRVAVN
jgi:hypothetical protein